MTQTTHVHAEYSHHPSTGFVCECGARRVAAGVWASAEPAGPVAQARDDRVRALLSQLRRYDDGTDGLGIIVRQALADNPDVTADEIAAICDEAEADARAARESE